MEVEELKKAIAELVDNGVRLKAIEEQLKMPANSLSGMLSGSRPFPKKWIPKLEAYQKMHKTIEQNTIPANKGRILAQREQLEDTILEDVAEYPLAGAEQFEMVEKVHQSPPPGLDKAQQIRWHRENSQTLH